MQIRSARFSDSTELARLSDELGYPTTPEAMAPRLHHLLANPGIHSIYVAAEDPSRLLGWIHVTRRDLLEWEPRAEILGLVVEKTARNGGIGRALVIAAERWAIEQGFEEIVVRSAVFRQESHPFYEHIGYERSKSQHVYHRRIVNKVAT